MASATRCGSSALPAISSSDPGDLPRNEGLAVTWNGVLTATNASKSVRRVVASWAKPTHAAGR